MKQACTLFWLLRPWNQRNIEWIWHWEAEQLNQKSHSVHLLLKMLCWQKTSMRKIDISQETGFDSLFVFK